jgi:hypothetical protein
VKLLVIRNLGLAHSVAQVIAAKSTSQKAQMGVNGIKVEMELLNAYLL